MEPIARGASTMAKMHATQQSDNKETGLHDAEPAPGAASDGPF